MPVVVVRVCVTIIKINIVMKAISPPAYELYILQLLITHDIVLT